MIVARPLLVLPLLLLTTTALAAAAPQTGGDPTGGDPTGGDQASGTISRSPAATAQGNDPATVSAPTGTSGAAPAARTRSPAAQSPVHQMPSARTTAAGPTPAEPTAGDAAPAQAAPSVSRPEPSQSAPDAPSPDTAVGAAPGPAADATPPLPTACLLIATDSTQGGPGAYDATQYVASVPNTSVKLTIARLTIDDPGHRLSARDAQGLAALSVLGAVSAAMGRAPAGCQDVATNTLVHGISSDVADGAAPRIVWRGVALQHGTHTLTATEVDASLRPDTNAGMLRLNADAHGIAEASSSHVIPSQVAADISAPESALETIGAGATQMPVTIHALHAVVGTPTGDVALDASGRATIAPDPHDTNADGRVTVTNLTALIDLARRSGQSMITTAMSVGQLVGHRSGDQTSWDIKYADSLILINNIPLPLSVH